MYNLAIRKRTSGPLLAQRLKIFKLKFTTPPWIEPQTCCHNNNNNNNNNSVIHITYIYYFEAITITIEVFTSAMRS